jgi:hypothetical protein
MSNIGDTSLKGAVELLHKQHPMKDFTLGKRQPTELQHVKPPMPIKQGC